MSDEGFNPEDIEDTLSRFGRGHKKSARPATAGIPSFVPREPAIQNNVNTPRDEVVWAAAADRAEQQQAQELPPASPCFSQADIDEFLARKPKKYQMTERDYKELGRNMALGIGDLIVGTVQASGLVLDYTHNPSSQSQNEDKWEWGTEGYGLYSGGVKICGID
ncbi:hypothetical protein ACFLXR_004742 [Salmonella enterica]|nr:hypothetical protein [Salmonella enterica]EGN2244744.1 hypothetical protein [Salmonella enterica]EKS9511476.1 hypothetical protein [Salmonella enterica]